MLVSIKKGLTTSVLAAFTLFLAGCHDDKTIKIGTIAGPETELAEAAAKVAEKRYGLHIKIVTFSNYLQPNAALNDGQLQANVFQHAPYLNDQITAHHYDLAIIGKTFAYPMGIYAVHFHSLNEVPDGSQLVFATAPNHQMIPLTVRLFIEKKKIMLHLSNQQSEITSSENITERIVNQYQTSFHNELPEKEGINFNSTIITHV